MPTAKQAAAAHSPGPTNGAAHAFTTNKRRGVMPCASRNRGSNRFQATIDSSATGATFRRRRIRCRRRPPEARAVLAGTSLAFEIARGAGRGNPNSVQAPFTRILVSNGKLR
jgi:hypothetical protein